MSSPDPALGLIPEPTSEPQPPTLKPGDLVLLAYPTNELYLVTHVSHPSTYVWAPEFSLSGEPGTWTINGPECYYTPLSDTTVYRPSRDILLPQSEIISVNPTGQEMMEHYWYRCPYWNCRNHMFCPGCDGASTDFPDLLMSCGVRISCPVCMGHEFAYEDKRIMVDLEYRMMGSGEREWIVKGRQERIDARRRELGYGPVDWRLYVGVGCGLVLQNLLYN